MIFAPHRLMVKVVSGPSFDEDMNPLPPKEDWKDFGSCRCDDNGVMKQISVNGVMYDYNYHVVYEGGILNAGTEVRILDGESVRAEGKVIKSGKSNYFKYAEIWLEILTSQMLMRPLMSSMKRPKKR